MVSESQKELKELLKNQSGDNVGSHSSIKADAAPAITKEEITKLEAQISSLKQTQESNSSELIEKQDAATTLMSQKQESCFTAVKSGQEATNKVLEAIAKLEQSQKEQAEKQAEVAEK